MRELDLLRQYLVKLRQDQLEMSHRCLVHQGRARAARLSAHKADFCDEIREAVNVLDNDPGQFIEKYMKREER